MDLLSVPNDPSFPALTTPLICTERWDGRRFLTYVHHWKAALSSIPYHLRNDHSLNDTDEKGTKLIKAAQAEAEIAALCSDYVVTEGETQYLAGAKLLECRQLVCQRNLGPDSDHQHRLDHLSECIRFASLTIDSDFWECSDRIKFSIGALAVACWAILYNNQQAEMTTSRVGPEAITPAPGQKLPLSALGCEKCSS
ncbi:hypothetical protein B0O99DRAFT_600121 [Bisporella sp. PMI_857]|nr:hypothetical protein B0O99DRAFT_600121 [Bisporella sp. PMI_857]